MARIPDRRHRFSATAAGDATITVATMTRASIQDPARILDPPPKRRALVAIGQHIRREFNEHVLLDGQLRHSQKSGGLRTGQKGPPSRFPPGRTGGRGSSRGRWGGQLTKDEVERNRKQSLDR